MFFFILDLLMFIVFVWNNNDEYKNLVGVLMVIYRILFFLFVCIIVNCLVKRFLFVFVILFMFMIEYVGILLSGFIIGFFCFFENLSL